MLRAKIGRANVLGSAGERRLWVLDDSNMILWDLFAAGIASSLIAQELAQRFELATEIAQSYVDQLEESWRAAGLLEVGARTRDSFEPIPAFPAPMSFQPMSGSLRLVVAQQTIILEIEDPVFREALGRLVAGLQDSAPSQSNEIANHAVLSGATPGWRLTINGAEVGVGIGRDEAILSTLMMLTELGCRTRERLLVVHGAGVVAPDSRCLLLAAPGGSGKSTLAIALEAEGFRLLSDDVVPIRSDGAAIGLGLPACVKRGSWPVLANLRPELAQAPDMDRFGQIVRLLPLRNQPVADAVTPTLLLFPRYLPDSMPRFTPLPPEQALQRLIEAEAVIRDLTQEKLEALCRWVESLSAYELSYPDLTRGVSLVRCILKDKAL